MADFVARFDPATGYVHICSADEFPIHPDVWTWMRGEPYRGEYSSAHRGELRFSKEAGAEVVAALSAAGHGVQPALGSRIQPIGPGLRGPFECVVCGDAYPVDKVVEPGELCRNTDRVRNLRTGIRESTHPPHALKLRPPPR